MVGPAVVDGADELAVLAVVEVTAVAALDVDPTVVVGATVVGVAFAPELEQPAPTNASAENSSAATMPPVTRLRPISRPYPSPPGP